MLQKIEGSDENRTLLLTNFLTLTKCKSWKLPSMYEKQKKQTAEKQQLLTPLTYVEIETVKTKRKPLKLKQFGRKENNKNQL